MTYTADEELLAIRHKTTGEFWHNTKGQWTWTQTGSLKNSWNAHNGRWVNCRRVVTPMEEAGYEIVVVDLQSVDWTPV